MEKLIIGSGVFIIVSSLLTMFFLRKKVDERIDILKNQELEYRDLRNDILELKDEFRKSAEEEVVNLDKKMRELNKTKVLLENKIKEGASLNQILETTFEKMNQIEINPPTEPKNETQYLEKVIVDYYKKGFSIREIAEKTGKSLNEIQLIMGLTLN